MCSFLKSESGASLVEYAVALVIVTIIGGAGTLAVGSDAGGMSELAGFVVDEARTDTEDAIN